MLRISIIIFHKSVVMLLWKKTDVKEKNNFLTTYSALNEENKSKISIQYKKKNGLKGKVYWNLVNIIRKAIISAKEFEYSFKFRFSSKYIAVKKEIWDIKNISTVGFVKLCAQNAHFCIYIFEKGILTSWYN